jgi:betaine-homocysteine S-methyltransferase
MTDATTDPLTRRLQDGPVLCAGGYLFELERRGYLTAGSFVPEVALEHPEVLAQVHREFVRAGSDIIEAFTYNAHREKLRLIGKEDQLEPLNRSALRTARAVAGEDWQQPPLVAGNISNTNIYDPEDPDTAEQVRTMYTEMVAWAAEEGADFILGETLYYLGEAQIALEVVREAGLEAVITLGVFADGRLRDGYEPAEAARIIADAGATVVGLNCFRGPETMLPHLEAIRAAVDIPVAGLPVPYRTSPNEPTFFNMHDHCCGVPLEEGRTFPTALEPFHCNRYEVADYARRARELGVDYLGLCCGNAPHFMRAVAEAVGREPPASRHRPEMDKHFLFGNDKRLRRHNTDFAGRA